MIAEETEALRCLSDRMTVGTTREKKYPRCEGTRWDVLRHPCTYYDWVARNRRHSGGQC